MTSLGFENYSEALKIYLYKYRETQSARGENQNRPPSSGYGGPVPGAASQGRPAGFPDSADGANSIMNPALDPSQQDPSAYGYAPMVGEPHNGAGGDSY